MHVSDSAALANMARARRSIRGACPDITHSLDCRCHGEAILTPASDDAHVIEAQPLPLEDDVQAEVRRLYVAAGCKVYWLSQKRKSGQSKGLADLFVFHRGRAISFWHECKRPGGELTDEQLEFRELCRATSTRHVSGGVKEARIAIDRWGLM